MTRKAFNFYRSYYDVFLMLESDTDKVQFITALLKKQFENIDTDNLSPMALFAYKSQEHNINSQIEGYLSKNKLGGRQGASVGPRQGASVGGRQGGRQGASVQEEEKEKGEEKGEEKGKGKEEEKEKEEYKEEGLFLENCKEIALKDQKWVSIAKTNSEELEAFNDHCILIGLSKKTPIDYKRHFVNWKKQNPQILVDINRKNRDDSW
jgi:hypothetical protein